MSHAKKVAFILSGCGFQDGTEIHEAVISMLSIEEAGAIVMPLAPFKNQAGVSNHLKGEVVANAVRSIPEEAARITRGHIKNLAEARATDFDALIIPGGFGAAKNLCNFADRGEAMTVDPEVERFVLEMHRSGKPIGAICIAPVLLAKIFGSQAPKLTIGRDKDTAAKFEAMGVKHIEAGADECVVDESFKFVTTPAYMLGETIRDIHPGIRKLVDAVLDMA